MMRITALFLLVFSIAGSPVFADESPLPRVVDEAGLLSAAEKAELERYAAAIREQYAFDPVIVTVLDTGEKTAEEYADDYFDYSGYGAGPDEEDGALFLHVLNGRYIHISGTGKGIGVFNSRHIDSALDKIVPSLREERYFEAYRIFLNQTKQYLDSAIQEKKQFKTAMHVLSVVLALIISLITFFTFRSKHKTIEPQQFARDYIKQGSLAFTARQDIFVSTFTAVSKRVQDVSVSRGTHTGSSGRSHSGGGRRY